jgi:hypothetical protein
VPRDVMSTIRVSPITDADVDEVAEFLHAHLNARVSVEDWSRAMHVPWIVDAPNHGFMLLDGASIVGCYLAFYSERRMGGRTERFCNLGAWCVLPDYRFHSLRLLNRLLAQVDYHFTDLSPSGPTVAVNTRLKFRSLNTTTALIANVPWPWWPGRTLISSDPAVIERTLQGQDLELYRDHQRSRAARHALLMRGGDSCYVMFRKDRRKNLPLFATILYVSDPELFRKMIGPFVRHLLFRHGALGTLAELRIVRYRPRYSLLLRSSRPKMFKSLHLQPDQIDDLYSELACVAW